MTKKKFLIFLFFVAFLSLGIFWPFLKQGYFPTHDGEWAVVRLAEMHREIRDFQFPPRWSGFLNHGFGYPLFLFTYPLPYYLGEFFNLTGFGLVDSVKIVFILSVFFSGLTMFLLGNKLWGKEAGLVASVFYLFLPWRMVDLYSRGSIGESLSFVFYPLLFWLGINLLEKKSVPWLAGTAFALAGLILTHNVMALLFIPFWFIFVIVSSVGEKSLTAIRHLLLAVLLGLFLSAFFWLPAIAEKKFVILGQMPIADIWENFVSPLALLLPSWGYGLPNQSGGFSFQIGWVHLLAFMLGLFFLKKDKFFYFLFLSFLVSVVLMMPISYPLWHYLPLLSDIDFPWRMLGITGFFVSLTAGGLVTSGIGRKIAVVLAFIVILVNFGYVKPQSYFSKGDDYYRTNDATTTSFDELMPVWVGEKMGNRSENLVFTKEKMTPEIHLAVNRSNMMAFTLDSPRAATLFINKIYFPGWVVEIDGRETPVDYNNSQGLISFAVPPGRHTARIIFQETLLRQIADYISLVSLIFLTTIFFFHLRKVNLFRQIIAKEKLVLLGIVILGVILRVYQIRERFVFDFDQQVTVSAMSQILAKKIVLVGQEVSVGGFFIGPLYYYFLTPFYLLTKFNLYSLVIPNLLVSVGAIVSVFFMAKSFVGQRAGFITSFLFAVSFPVIGYDQITAPSNPLMFLASLFFILLFLFMRGFYFCLPLMSFLLGLSLHLHPSALPLFIIFGLLILTAGIPKISNGLVILSILIFLIMISPLIAFDLRHDFLNLRGVLSLAGRSGGVSLPISQFFWLLKVQLDNFNNFFFPSFLIFKILSAGILLSFLGTMVKFRQNYARISKIVLAWFFIPLLFFSFYGGHIPEYYLLITFPLLIFIFGFMINVLWHKGRVLQFLTIFLVFLSLFFNLARNFMFQNPFSLKYKEEAIDYIFADSQDKPGKISITTEKGLNFGYEILIKNKNIQQGETLGKYSLIAPWNLVDGPEEHYFGGIKVIKRL